MNGKIKITDYKTAYEEFVDRFLKGKKSIFNLENDDDVLTGKGIKYLKEKFINNGYDGDADSIEKFCHQLTTKTVETAKHADLTNEQKNAIEILATAIWLWRLPPSNTKKVGRIKNVKEILSLNKDNENIDLKTNPFFDEKIKGFASPGTYYNTNKPFELAYIIKFFELYLSEDKPLDIIDKLKNEEEFKGKVEIKVTGKYSKDLNLTKASASETKTAVIHNGLLHLIEPGKFEPILSNKHKEKIVKTFENEYWDNNKESDDLDDKIEAIKKGIQEKFKTDKFKSFYQKGIVELWQGGLDFNSKNTILHGAPGTGKTFLTETTVKLLKKMDNNIDYKLVQFHPSYSYEDFIDGIKPAGISGNGNMKFELVNGEFKQMCIDAFKELIKERDDKLNKEIKDDKKYKAKRYYFIADEVNRAELSRVFGELLICIEEDKRLRFDKKGELFGTKVKTQNSMMWEKKDAVVIIKEEDSEKFEMYFGIPENIYFIGTMNDIDRSIDSFDMALRRRFVWIQYKCDYDVIYDKFKTDPKVNGYIKICEELNAKITSKNGFNLGESYELGHSYFMKPKKLKQVELDKIWGENIAPLLKEYLRSQYANDEIDKKIKEVKNKFKL